MERRGAGSGGGMGGLPIPMGKAGGIGGLVVLLIVLFLGGRSITGGDGGSGYGLPEVLNGIPANQPAAQEGQPITAPTESEAFIAFVLDDVQQTWAEQFRQAGRQARRLVSLAGQRLQREAAALARGAARTRRTAGDAAQTGQTVAFLDHGIPLAAGLALALPAGRGRAAVLADEGLIAAGH